MLIERKWRKWVLFYAPLAVFIVFTLFPFYWAVVSSLKTGSALFDTAPWPREPAWSNYAQVF